MNITERLEIDRMQSINVLSSYISEFKRVSSQTPHWYRCSKNGNVSAIYNEAGIELQNAELSDNLKMTNSRKQFAYQSSFKEKLNYLEVKLCRLSGKKVFQNGNKAAEAHNFVLGIQNIAK